MKKLIMILLVMVFMTLTLEARYNPYSLRSLDNSLKTLSKYQIKNIKRVIRLSRNKQEAILALSVMWQESSFGAYKVLRDKRDYRNSSYGYFHATLKTVKWNLKKRGINYSYNKIRRLLLRDMKFNMYQYRKNMRYWKKIRHGNLKQALACYNGGYKGYKRKASKRYSKLVRLKMIAINRYLKKKKLI